MKNIISTILLFFVLFFAMSAENTIENKIQHTGTVKFYNENKGFGYIIDNHTQDELFIYEENLIDEITDNDKVNYYITDTRKGLEAVAVRLK